MRALISMALTATAVVVASVQPVLADPAPTAFYGPAAMLDGPADRNTEPPLPPPPAPPPEALVQPGDTLYALADAWGVDRQLAQDANADLLSGNPDLILPGWRLKMPGGHEPLPEVLNSALRVGPRQAFSATTGPTTSNRFYYGYCTWYVATRRAVTWLGNAIDWWANARAQGQPEGATPRVGSIMVTAESAIGHVAYVEQVNGDGSWVVSEMNYVHWGPPATQRTLRFGQVPLLGFIY